MNRVRKPDCYCMVANTYLPVLSLNVSLGSNGSLSSVDGTSSLSLLAASGIDVYSAGQTDEGASIEAWMGFEGSSQKIMTGTLDEFDFDVDGDLITFRGRDNAASLADTKETTAAINYKNQTIGQVVTQIAKKFNLTPNVTDPGILAGDDMWDNSHYMSHGQQYWSMLQDLAQQCGYECFVKPNSNELYFGPLESAGGDAVTVSIGLDTASNPVNPVMKPKFLYQPRRNSNVEVQVISYHPLRNIRIKSKAKAVAQTGSSKDSGNDYIISKGGATGVQGAKSGGTKPSAKPIVTKRIDGLTQEKADSIAQSMAKDIAKRQIIFSGTIEGLPTAQLHSQVSIKKGDMQPLFGFEKFTYILSTVNHKYTSTNGYTTEFVAMTNPQIETN